MIRKLASKQPTTPPSSNKGAWSPKKMWVALMSSTKKHFYKLTTDEISANEHVFAELVNQPNSAPKIPPAAKLRKITSQLLDGAANFIGNPWGRVTAFLGTCAGFGGLVTTAARAGVGGAGAIGMAIGITALGALTIWGGIKLYDRYLDLNGL